MKFLIIQENGRNDINRNFRECFVLKRSLDKLGIETIVWGLGHENFNKSFTDISKDVDAILLLENYETGSWLPDLSKSNKLKLFWSIDSHVILQSHLSIVSKHKIDIVLHSVYGHDKFFKNFKPYWFPNAYAEDLISFDPNLEKLWDIGFCGHVNNRGPYLNLIGTNFNLKKDISVLGKDMVKSINQYKIHFNRNIGEDINFRTFETLGCKTFLLTNETPGLKYLFDIGNNIITYTDKDLLDKIKFYLDNESERSRLEILGWEHVRLNHTYVNRSNQLLSILQENI